MTTTDRLLLVRHSVHWPIDEATAKDALPQNLLRQPSTDVPVDNLQCSMEDAKDLDWTHQQRLLREAFDASIAPTLRAGPCIVAYFGAAPIPLAVQLGFLVGTWAPIVPFQRHHGPEKGWRWETEELTVVVHTSKPAIGSLVGARGDVVVRISTWHEILDPHVNAVVPDPLADYRISLEAPGSDALRSQKDLCAVADAFEAVLDHIMDHFPRVDRVHLFAGVPVGLAFALGARVSATKHPRIQTYQFVVNQSGDREYRPAFVLQEAPRARGELTESDLELARAERDLWVEELACLSEACKAWRSQSAPWWTGFGALPPNASLACPPWARLPSLSELALEDTHVAADAGGSSQFRFEMGSRSWVLSDELLLALGKRLKDDWQRRAAARLFFMHEILHHRGPHRLTEQQSAGVGRFPRILEELDYQADVWAIVHDMVRPAAADETSDVAERARRLITVVTETFWAFDDGANPDEVPVRRFNRFLLWYWQLARMVRARSAEDVLHILALKPLLELTGVETRVRGERVVYLLNRLDSTALELSVLWDGVELCRRPQGIAFPVRQVIESFRARDSGGILRTLEGFLDSLDRRQA